ILGVSPKSLFKEVESALCETKTIVRNNSNEKILDLNEDLLKIININLSGKLDSLTQEQIEWIELFRGTPKKQNDLKTFGVKCAFEKYQQLFSNFELLQFDYEKIYSMLREIGEKVSNWKEILKEKYENYKREL